MGNHKHDVFLVKDKVRLCRLKFVAIHEDGVLLLPNDTTLEKHEQFKNVLASITGNVDGYEIHASDKTESAEYTHDHWGKGKRRSSYVFNLTKAKTSGSIKLGHGIVQYDEDVVDTENHDGIKIQHQPIEGGRPQRENNKWRRKIRKHAPIVCIVSSVVSLFLLFVTSLVGLPQIVMGLIRGLTAFACFSSLGYLGWQVAGFFGYQPDQIQPYLEVPDYNLRFEALGSADVRVKHPVVETLGESYDAEIIGIHGYYKILMKNCENVDEILGMTKNQKNPTWLKNIVIYEEPSWTWSLSKFGASRHISMFPLPNGHEQGADVYAIDSESFWLVRKGQQNPEMYCDDADDGMIDDEDEDDDEE